MINNNKILAIIPARGGSKGLHRKNVQLLNEKPLIHWTIEAALHSKYIDRIIVSSDDDEILSITDRYGKNIGIKRPNHLATDTARNIEVIHDLLSSQGGDFDFVMLLQPTSPLRTPEDIDNALAFCLSRNAPACISVNSVNKSPHWIVSINKHGSINPVLPTPKGISRRQDMQEYFEVNGAIYLARIDWLLSRDSFLSDQTVAYVMPKERSLDIDTEDDFKIAEIQMHRLSQNTKEVMDE